MAAELKVGDIVQLRSGGPKMTIKQIIPEFNGSIDLMSLYRIQGYQSGDVLCQWFSEERLKDAAFRKETLKKTK